MHRLPQTRPAGMRVQVNGSLSLSLSLSLFFPLYFSIFFSLLSRLSHLLLLFTSLTLSPFPSCSEDRDFSKVCRSAKHGYKKKKKKQQKKREKEKDAFASRRARISRSRVAIAAHGSFFFRLCSVLLHAMTHSRRRHLSSAICRHFIKRLTSLARIQADFLKEK